MGRKPTLNELSPLTAGDYLAYEGRRGTGGFSMSRLASPLLEDGPEGLPLSLPGRTALSVRYVLAAFGALTLAKARDAVSDAPMRMPSLNPVYHWRQRGEGG